MSMSKENISRNCNKKEKRLVISKNVIIIIILSIILLTSFFYMSSIPSKINVSIKNIDIDDETKIITYNKTSSSFENISIKDIDNEWFIYSIELFLSPHKLYYTKNYMINSVIYGNNIYDQENINSLSIELYKATNETTNSNYKSINNTYYCPSEYSLSYITIKIKSRNENLIFDTQYYHFYQNEENTETKPNRTIKITIKSLNFNENEFDNWYNWIINKIKPSITNYPYTINLQ